MWAALGIIAIIALSIVGLITGTIWFAGPVVVLAIVVFLVTSGSLRSDQDHVARAEEGPRTDREVPEDTPGGPEHEATGFAHEGQRT